MALPQTALVLVPAATATDALEYVTAIYRSEGNQAPGWIACGVLVGIAVWVYLRKKPRLSRSLPLALATGRIEGYSQYALTVLSTLRGVSISRLCFDI